MLLLASWAPYGCCGGAEVDSMVLDRLAKKLSVFGGGVGSGEVDGDGSKNFGEGISPSGTLGRLGEVESWGCIDSWYGGDRGRGFDRLY
jgi:hypothetical protein